VIEEEHDVDVPPPQVGPRISPKERFAATKRAVVFFLGVAVIIDSFFESSHAVAQLVIGTILVGVLPIDDFLESIRNRPRLVVKTSKNKDP
jgi:hypothetical protein